MEYLVGISLALGVSLFGKLSGFERDRAFYPTMTVVIAATYELFAVMAGSTHALSLESAVFVFFALAAVVGFKSNLWIVVAALAGHGVFDLAHPHLIANPGVPAWWPAFCMTYDISAALYLAWLLHRRILSASTPDHQSLQKAKGMDLPNDGHPIL